MGSRAKSVQAREPETVIEMYKAMACPSFSISQGSQFLFCFENESIEQGVPQLVQVLEWLDDSGAIYTLKVYDIDSGITDKTGARGSFNFCFYDPQGMSGAPPMASNAYRSYTNALEKRLEKLEREREEEEEDDGSGLGVIGKILDSGIIEQIPVIVGVVRELFGKPAIQDIPASEQISGVGFPVDDVVRPLDESLQILKSATPDLEALLSKLATVAQKNPIKFKVYLATLRSLK